MKVGALWKKQNTKIWVGDICAGIDETENLESLHILELSLREETSLSHCLMKPVFPESITSQGIVPSEGVSALLKIHHPIFHYHPLLLPGL